MISAIQMLFVLGLVFSFGCEDSQFNSGAKEQQQLKQDPNVPAQSDDAEKIDSVLPDSTVQIGNCDPGSEIIKTKSIELAFTQRKACTFGLNDNLPAKSGFMTAKESETKEVILPANTELCAFSLSSTANDLHYDDYLFLSLNDKLLVASEIGWAGKLEKIGELINWNWLKIRGSVHADVEKSANYGTPYCLGDSACVLPKHDAIGAFKYSINKDSFRELFKSLENPANLNFQITATGDNNADDCDHSSFNLILNVAYVGAEF